MTASSACGVVRAAVVLLVGSSGGDIGARDGGTDGLLAFSSAAAPIASFTSAVTPAV